MVSCDVSCPIPKMLACHVTTRIIIDYILGGGFKYFLFSPLLGEDFQFDYIIFFGRVETTNYLYMLNMGVTMNLYFPLLVGSHPKGCWCLNHGVNLDCEHGRNLTPYVIPQGVCVQGHRKTCFIQRIHVYILLFCFFFQNPCQAFQSYSSKYVYMDT